MPDKITDIAMSPGERDIVEHALIGFLIKLPEGHARYETLKAQAESLLKRIKEAR